MWLLGLLAGAVLFAVGGITVMQAGLYDVAATSPHNPQVGWVLHNTMIHSVRLRADRPGPLPRYTPGQVEAGRGLYDAHCVVCHGGPGVARARWADGLTPTPPFLEDTAQHWTAPELRRIVANGVKMSAMPAWSSALSDAEVDELVAFLEELPRIAPADYQSFHTAQCSASPGRCPG